MEENIKTGKKILIIDDDVNMMDILSVVLEKYGHHLYAYTDPVSAIDSSSWYFLLSSKKELPSTLILYPTPALTSVIL